MRAEDLALALGGLDESFIAPAAADMLSDGKRRVPRMVKLFAIAAAAVTVAVLLLLAGLSVGKPRTPVSHPEATVRTEPGEPGGNNGGRPDLPVVKPGASPEKSTGTETETDPPVTEPPATEPTEPGYTEPAPVTEPEQTEQTPTDHGTERETETRELSNAGPGSDPPAYYEGLTNDEIYVILYRAFLSGDPAPAEENSGQGTSSGQVAADPEEISAARTWYRETFEGNVEETGPNTATPATAPGESFYPAVPPFVSRASFAERLYTMARSKGVTLPAKREWTGFDDFADGKRYSDAVFAVYRAGLMDGISEGHFGIREPVTARDVASAAAKLSVIIRDYQPSPSEVRVFLRYLYDDLEAPDLNLELAFPERGQLLKAIETVDLEDRDVMAVIWCCEGYGTYSRTDIDVDEIVNVRSREPLTREGLALLVKDVFDVLGADMPKTKAVPDFIDVADSGDGAEAVTAVCCAGIMDGVTKTEFKPDRYASPNEIYLAAAKCAGIIIKSGALNGN